MLSQGQELNVIDFADIIGGPLIAVINAQAKAAHVTSNFIDTVAFTSPTGQPKQLKVVSFDFRQVLADPAQALGSSSQLIIKVPLLTLLPIPYIRVDSMTVTLNVSLHSTQAVGLTNDFTFNSTVSDSESAFFGLGPAMSFQASVTDRNTYQNDQLTDDTYSMNVTVHAVQDQMPAGMSQILGIFSNVIQSQSALVQALVTAQVQALTNQITTPAAPKPPS